MAGLALVGAAPAGWIGPLPKGIAPPAVPADNPMSAARIELGRRLFYDADLSRDGTVACATCHEQKHAFADGNITHPGVTGEPGRRNVPGLANVAWFSPLTYADPRQTTLEAQVAVPVAGTHPVEMGMTGHEGDIAARLDKDACYRTMFAQAFPGGHGQIDFAHVRLAIASFERTMTSYGSAWDRTQMSPQAAQGARRFARDCAACHQGPRFTDLAFHRIGPADPAAPDQGLAEITRQPADAGKFRTPSLRNVTLTGPWWHDGSARSLDAAVTRHGKAYAPAEMAALLAFLDALTDREFTQRPALGLPRMACGKAL